MVLVALAGVILVLVFLVYALTPGVGGAWRRVMRIGGERSQVALALADTRLAQAVVAVEDRRFYEHGAVDPLALARAAGTWVSGSRVDPGGSTIAQQLARVLYGQHAGVLGPIQDAMVAFKLESEYSKRQVLAMYLSSVYLGQGAYGAARASQVYFHKPVGRLDWAEASMLAGLPQAPSAFDPITHFALARVRQREVLAALVRAHLLTRARAAAAFSELRSLEG